MAQNWGALITLAALFKVCSAAVVLSATELKAGTEKEDKTWISCTIFQNCTLCRSELTQDCLSSSLEQFTQCGFKDESFRFLVDGDLNAEIEIFGGTKKNVKFDPYTFSLVWSDKKQSPAQHYTANLDLNRLLSKPRSGAPSQVPFSYRAVSFLGNKPNGARIMIHEKFGYCEEEKD